MPASRRTRRLPPGATGGQVVRDLRRIVQHPPVTMTRIRLLLAVAALAVAGVAATAAAPAAAAKPCWQELIDDWYDGHIDKTYPTHCYKEAIDHLPTDVEEYGSAQADIQRALAAAIAAKRNPPKPGGGAKAGGKTPPKNAGGGTASTPPPTPRSTTTTTTTTAAPDVPGGTNGPASVLDLPPRLRPSFHGGPNAHYGGKPTKNLQIPNITNPTSGPADTPSAAPAAPPPTADPGGDEGRRADAFPLPVIVLAAVGGVLLLLGGAGFMARRSQTRRVRVHPAADGPTARDR